MLVRGFLLTLIFRRPFSLHSVTVNFSAKRENIPVCSRSFSSKSSCAFNTRAQFTHLSLSHLSLSFPRLSPDPVFFFTLTVFSLTCSALTLLPRIVTLALTHANLASLPLASYLFTSQSSFLLSRVVFTKGLIPAHWQRIYLFPSSRFNVSDIFYLTRCGHGDEAMPKNRTAAFLSVRVF